MAAATRLSSEQSRPIKNISTGRPANGLISDALLTHMKIQSRVGIMLTSLETARQKKIQTAREALQKNDKTRDLLDRANIDNIAAARHRSVALGPVAVAFTKRMIWTRLLRPSPRRSMRRWPYS